jgi:hypothetical protein
MLRLRKSILGAALLAGLATAAISVPAEGRPVWGPHGHWVHGWHGGRFGWWWAGPRLWYWYPPPVYADYPPPDYLVPAGPAPAPAWYYCDSARGYYPYVRFCPEGWRAVPAVPPGEIADIDAPASSPPPKTSKL